MLSQFLTAVMCMQLLHIPHVLSLRPGLPHNVLHSSKLLKSRSVKVSR